MLKQLTTAATIKLPAAATAQSVRAFGVAAVQRSESGDGKPGFLDRVFGTKVEKATQAHSVLLADQQILYELQSESTSFFL